MKKFILNVGLNVGYIEPRTQEDSAHFHLKNVLGDDLIINKRVKISTWGTENVLVVSGLTPLDFVPFKKLVQQLCSLLYQDAIAFILIDGEELKDLAYKEGYKGEFIEFNEDFFLRK